MPHLQLLLSLVKSIVFNTVIVYSGYDDVNTVVESDGGCLLHHPIQRISELPINEEAFETHSEVMGLF